MEKVGFGLSVTERELNILQDLYEYRALTTEQIKNKHFPDTKYAVDNVMKKLRKRKMVTSRILKGSREKRKGYSYHRVTEIGMECLARHGVSVEGTVQSLYVKPAYLYYVLMANDVITELPQSKWGVWDSRKVKREYNVDKGTQIHLLLTDPNGKEYGFYVMDKGITPKNLGKIISEIRDWHSTIHNFIVFAKGNESYKQFMEYATNPPRKRDKNNRLIEQKPLYTGYDLKLIPFTIGKELYKKYPTKKEWHRELAQYYGFEIISDISDNNDNEIGVMGGKGALDNYSPRQSFDTIIRYQGKEMYLVDLTDSNLTLIFRINNYKEHNFRRENKRKILVTTSVKDVMKYIEDTTYIEQLAVGSIIENKLIN